MSVRVVAFLAGLTALAVPIATVAAEVVTTRSVNIRAGAGVDNMRIGTLPPGSPMSVDHCHEGWCLGSARGLRGWVSARYLSVEAVEAEPQVETYVPPVIAVPSVPTVKFPFVMPDRGFHDYGLGRAHKFQRTIK